MIYKKGDIVSVEPIKMKDSPMWGRIFVKIVKKKDGLYFAPLLEKYARSVPISMIDYFKPLRGMTNTQEFEYETDVYFKRLGTIHNQVLWGTILITWKETNGCLKMVKDLLTGRREN